MRSVESIPGSKATPADWDRVTETRVGSGGLWRTYCDLAGSRLIADLVAGRHGRRALKTDLYDEAVGVGLVPTIATLAEEVHGIDVAAGVVAVAADRYPALNATVADVRSLPFSDEYFDLVVSTSTLDHLPDVDAFRVALGELYRVLVPGGLLLITVDNRANPVVALRSRLPHVLLRRLRLAPFYVGMAVTQSELSSHLDACGYVLVTERITMHVPRLPAVWVCSLVDRFLPRGSTSTKRLVRALIRFEGLGRRATRERTGYYVAAVALRPPREAA